MSTNKYHNYETQSLVAMSLAGLAVAMGFGCLQTEEMLQSEASADSLRIYEPGSDHADSTIISRDRVTVAVGQLELPNLSAERTQKVPQDDEYDSYGPAKGVEYFEVYAVGSSNIGWELVDAYQYSTVEIHGGALMRVAVLQYGYGNGGAQMNGVPGNHYLRELLCGPLWNLHRCSVGETVTGFLDYYSFDGLQGGSFSAYTDSIAPPHGRHHDSINIR